MEQYTAFDKTIVVSFYELGLSPGLYLVLGSGFNSKKMRTAITLLCFSIAADVDRL